MPTLTTRDRFQAIMHFQSFDRLPVVEWAEWWDETIERWHKEGLPRKVKGRYEICRHLNLDIYRQDWFRGCTIDCPQPSFHGGGIIKSLEGYEALLPCLYPARVIDVEHWEDWADEQERGDVVLWFTVEGFFWFPRALLGIDNHFYAFYDQPKLLHRINSDLSEWILGIIEKVCSICTPDFMTFAEDLSCNKGPMLSKEFFDEYLKPYYNLVIPTLQQYGIIPFIDSDGDISAAVTWFEEVEIAGILPLERHAGVDIAALRSAHPRMLFIGHFDKMTMHRGELAMRAEFERLLPVAVGGGFIIGCDHQTPPGVSYSDYQLYISLFREYAQEAGRISRTI